MSEYTAIVWQAGNRTRVTFAASSLDDARLFAERLRAKLARRHGRFNPVTVEVLS